MILRITLFYIILCSSCSFTENQSNNFEHQNNDSEHQNNNSELITNNPLELMEPKKSFSNYTFDIPSASFFLDKKLTEISSLAYDKEDHSFITNNDESGTIFTLRPESFKIKRKEKFAKKGDYEAIEKIGNTIILCESSGKLYFYDRNSKKTTTYKTELSIKNNVEGLCYKEQNHSLLLACKAKTLDENKNTKCVYQFDLAQKKLITQPFLSIYQNELKSLVKSTFSDLSKSKLKNLKNRAAEFSPSGIAIHPKTGEYFLTSAKGSLLLILTKTKILKEIIFLDKKAIPQPEGLCFDKDSNLYISTEGQGSSGKILKFNFND